jgi:hypothetical protein
MSDLDTDPRATRRRDQLAEAVGALVLELSEDDLLVAPPFTPAWTKGCSLEEIFVQAG